MISPLLISWIPLDQTGFIALQVHAVSKPEYAGEKVYWKNIRIKTTDLAPLHFRKECLW